MLAEIYGKISSSGSNLSDRMEDQLVGDVFGALRYIDPGVGLIPILNNSYFLNKGERVPLNLSMPDIARIKFWPWLVESEPDLLIELTEVGNKTTVIVVEAKYCSGLSTDDVPKLYNQDSELKIPGSDNACSNQDIQTKISCNQLVRQMRGMKEKYPGCTQVQLFLTADKLYPKELLDRVRIQADKEKLNDIKLYWLSWHDLPDAINKSLKKTGLGLLKRERIVVSDLLKLFTKKGFGRFKHFDIPRCLIPGSYKINESTLLKSIKIPSPIFISLPIIPHKINYLQGDTIWKKT